MNLSSVSRCAVLAALLAFGGVSEVKAESENQNESEISWRLYQLSPPDKRAEFYHGNVDYAKIATLSFEVAGRLDYVAPEGTNALSDILNLTGGVIREGTLIAQQDDQLAKNQVNIAEARLEALKLRLEEKRQNYERDKKLFERRTISERTLLESETGYLSALFDRDAAVGELEVARRHLDACFIRAPFPGVVRSVSLRAGTVADVAQEVLSFAAVNAMKIEIPLPEYVTRQLDLTTQLRVYPNNAAKPVTAWFENRDIKTAQLTCYVDNPTIPVGELTPEQATLPVVDQLSFVFEPSPSNAGLAQFWVLPAAIKCAADGSHYIWKLKDLTAVAPDSRLPRQVVMEQIPVEPLDQEYNQGIYRLRGINTTGDLKAYDLVAATVPETLQSGANAVYQTRRHLFRPGEKVNVVFSRQFEPPVFTVPRSALEVDHTNGSFSLKSWDNGAIFAIPVAILTENDDTVQVRCTSLRPGMLVVVPPSDMLPSAATPEVLQSAPIIH